MYVWMFFRRTGCKSWLHSALAGGILFEKHKKSGVFSRRYAVIRKVEQLDICYSNGREKRCSVFAGVCLSRELFEQYYEKDYDLLYEDYIGFEAGIDFGINMKSVPAEQRQTE